MWRPGKQYHDSWSSIEFGFEPLSWSGALGIRQHDCTLQHVGLLRIVLGHREPPFRKALIHRRDDFVVASQPDVQCGGHALTGEVVLRWTKSAHENADFGARDGCACHTREVIAIVANHCLEGDANPQFVEAAREEEGIRVLPGWGKHLGADSDDFSDHDFSLAGSNHGFQPAPRHIVDPRVRTYGPHSPSSIRHGHTTGPWSSVVTLSI